VNNTLERIWQEPAVTISSYYSRNNPEELGKITKVFSDFGVLAEIRIYDIPLQVRRPPTVSAWSMIVMFLGYKHVVMTNDATLLHNVIHVLNISHSVWKNISNGMK
jgi:hypothetical protein